MAPKEGIIHYTFKVSSANEDMDPHVAMGFVRGNETMLANETVFLDSHNFKYF